MFRDLGVPGNTRGARLWDSEGCNSCGPRTTLAAPHRGPAAHHVLTAGTGARVARRPRGRGSISETLGPRRAGTQGPAAKAQEDPHQPVDARTNFAARVTREIGRSWGVGRSGRGPTDLRGCCVIRAFAERAGARNTGRPRRGARDIYIWMKWDRRDRCPGFRKS